jgi:hypothetical protein
MLFELPPEDPPVSPVFPPPPSEETKIVRRFIVALITFTIL